MILQQRIQELEGCAQDEGIRINPASLKDVTRWAEQPRDGYNLFLLDSGNFRAISKLDAGTEEGIEFIGNGIMKNTVIRRYENGKRSLVTQLIQL
jgi:hypothetical protein